MARTRRTISPQRLNRVDVLIEDRGTRSDYFKLSQFDGYFSAGRNAFLVAGSTILRPRSKVLVEILTKDGSSLFSTPIPTFLEGNSKLYQVEVYKDTPIGPGKIIILGSTTTYADGTPIPDEWQGKINVRWVTDVIISPLVKNRDQIRFQNTPELFVEEKFYPTPSSSFFSESVSIPVDIDFQPKFFNVYHNGYLAKINDPSPENRYFTKYLGGKFTGSIEFSDGVTTERANIDLPITKIFNTKLAEVNGRLIIGDKNTTIKNAFISSSGEYTSSINLKKNLVVSSSLSLNYNELVQEDTGSLISFAKLRLVNLSTLSGEVDKVRFSYKASTDPGGFTFLGEVPTSVTELFSDDINNEIVETGKFNNIPDIEVYWYSATMSVANIRSEGVPDYYLTASIITESQFSDQCCGTLLDSINATPLVNNEWPLDVNNLPVPYIIGNRETNSTFLFPRSEYTLKFDSVVEKVSASIELDQPDYSLEVYLVPTSGSDSRILDTNPLGQFIGKLTPIRNFQVQNFETQEFNFIPAINKSGEYGIRFLVRGGFWNIANVSLKVAQEEFYSPDEIDALLPVLNYGNDIITFQAEFLNVDNDSLETIAVSLPTFFTGSEISEDGCNCDPGLGLLLDDNSFTLDTGSSHFTDGVKNKLDDDFVISGSDIEVKTFLSLENVDNTSDDNKPLSTAQKTYIDEVAQGIKARTSARVLVDFSLDATYDNGTNGSGSFLEANSNGEFPTIDGVDGTELNVVGTRILVAAQSNSAHNGLYVLQTPGDSETPWKIRRCIECDSDEEIPGSFIFVKSGTLYTSTGWVLVVSDPTTFTIGTDSINVIQFSGVGSFLAGDGLDLDVNIFSLNTGSVHFAGGIKTTLNSNTVISGSEQVFINSTDGTLNVNKGGTGQTEYFNGELLIGNTTGNTLTKSTLTAGTGIGISNGTGTITISNTGVTSVGGTGTVSGLTLSGTVTTTGNLTLGGTLSVTPSNFSSQTANTFLAAPNGTAGTPTFRAIVAADVPTLNQNTTGTAANITATSNTTLTSLANLITVGTITTGTWNAGTIAIARGGTGATTQQAAINALAGAVTSGQYLRGNGTNVVMSAIQAVDVPTLNQNTTGQAGSVAQSVTFNNDGSGAVSGTTFNGSTARIISYNTIGAPSTTGTNASGTWGINITGNAATVTNGVYTSGDQTIGGIKTFSNNSIFNGNISLSGPLNITRNTDVINITPETAGSYSLINFNSRVNLGSDKAFILVQDESANSPGTSTEDLRMTIGVFNDFRQSTAHSDELWLQGGGRLVYNVGTWDSELNSIIGTPSAGTTGGYEWRVNNSVVKRITHAGDVGIGVEPTQRLHVSGQIIATNEITAFFSDERLKTKLGNINDAIGIITKLNTFKYKPNEIALSQGFDDGVYVGLSAQEVQEVLPEIIRMAPFDQDRDEEGNLISKSGENYLTLDYSKLVPVLIEAIKELVIEVNTLKQNKK
jgi:hypothetical protein